MFENREGKRVPDTTFRVRCGHEWTDVTSSELFGGKTVAVFSLPGAFTPTCSSSHVPRYDQLAPQLRANGVDEIVCMSVNDAFVMNEWQASQKADRIRFIPDGNGAFTQAMGMLVDKQELGFGKRSWRYSMLVKDGVIDKMFIEPEMPGDPFGISDADTMLAYVAPDAGKPLDVTLMSRDGCPFCVRAKEALRSAGIDYEELILNQDYTDRSLRAIAASASVPQVFVNGNHIGGAEDLERWLSERKAA